MKVEIKYICEVCDQKYDTESSAIECESRGVFDLTKFPIGLMFEYHHHGFVGIFSIATIDLLNHGHGKNHLGRSSHWACRTINYLPNSLGDEKCGGDYLYSDKENIDRWIDYHKITKEKVNCPEYDRMVKYLKSVGITPTYYNEQKDLITLN